MTKSLTPFEKILHAVADIWGKLVDGISGVDINFDAILQGIAKFIQEIGPAIGKAASTMNFDAILEVIRTGFFVGLVVMLKKFLGKGSLLEQIGKGGGGFLGNLSEAFKTLTGTMKAMQQNIKADTLMKIAIAIALLTASVVALSFVNPDDLKKSLAAITVMFGQLLGAMTILDKIGSSKGMVKMPFIAGAMILLAGAIDLLAIAVIALGKQNIEELKKGLGAVAFLLGAISAAVIPLSANAKGLIRASVAMNAIAGSLILLTVPVVVMGRMDLVSLGKGLGGVAAGLLLMTYAMQQMPKVPLKSSAGIVAMAGSLVILSAAIKIMGSMDLVSLGKGLGGMAAGLLLMVYAMQKMPEKSMLKNAIGVLALAGAMRILADALVKMGGMSIEQMGHALAVLGSSLLFLTVALNKMEGSVGGAVALGIAAAGLALLVPSLVLLGKQSVETIAKGLIGLAGALVVIGGTAALLSTLEAPMLAFGAALVVVGAGLALAGAGVFLIGAGLSAIAVAGTASIGILVAALIQLSKAWPEIAKNLVLGLVEMVKAITDAAPEFVKAIVAILNMLLDAVIKIAPKIATAFTALMTAAIKILHDNQDRIIQAGLDLLLALLNGIRNNIGKVVNVVADIIVKFLDAIANRIHDIIDAGTNVLIKFLKGIGDNLNRIVTTVGNIIATFITTIVGKYADIVKAGFNAIVKFIEGMGSNLKAVVIAGGQVIVKFIQGIGEAASSVVTQARKTAKLFMDTVATEIPKFVDDVFNAIIKLMNSLAEVINRRSPELRKAGINLAEAIIDGFTFGLGHKADKLYDKAKEIGKKALDIMKHPWKVFSPSVTMFELGGDIMQGWVNGMDANAKKVFKSAEMASYGVLNKFKDIFASYGYGSQLMQDIGQSVLTDFAKGLLGSAASDKPLSAIDQVFVDLNTKVTEGIRSTKDKIDTENKKLIELQGNKQTKENSAAILRKQNFSMVSMIF
jgi:hypothetical protein